MISKAYPVDADRFDRVPGAPSAQDLAAGSLQQLHELQVYRVELELQNEELRHSRAQLEAQAVRYADLYDFAPVGYFTLQPNGAITHANQLGSRLLGFEPARLTGQRLGCYVILNDLPGFNAFLRRVFTTRRDQTCEVELVAAEGQPLITVRIDATRAIDAAQCRAVMVDISERKRSEQALVQSEARFRALADLSSDWYWEMDSNLRTTRLDARFEEAAALAVESEIDTGCCELTVFNLTQADRDRYRALLEEHAEFRNFEALRVDSAGKSCWVSLSGTPVHDAKGQFSGYRGVASDISESKRLSQSLHVQELSRRLVQAQEKARQRFARDLHDRTSPNLAALRINLDMIAAASPLERDSEAFADRVADARALIEDTTLSIREISAGLHPPALDRGGLLAVLQNYASQFSLRTGMQVSIDCPHGEVRLAHDLELALFRIVQEALTNCAKHARARRVLIQLQLDAQPMQISVSDDGIGFDVEELTGGSQIMGLGLGLITMRETAEFSGGSLCIESVRGAGTRILISI